MLINDYDKFNSMTKYPSIVTYHEMGQKGKLQSSLSVKLPEDVTLKLTEKIDGTNCRLIMVANRTEYDYFIGSREELLTAKNDRIPNVQMGVVAELKPICNNLCASNFAKKCGVFVIFGEFYGGKLPATKMYSKMQLTDFRVFDVMYISFTEISELMTKTRAEIAAWRDNGGQTFFTNVELSNFCDEFNLKEVPFLTFTSSSDFPVTLKDTYEFMKNFEKTKAGIDFSGASEGFIGRTSGRGIIFKCRFEDYKRSNLEA
jgi:hypothetical protein